MKSPKPTSLKLQSAIEQCEAALVAKTTSLQGNYVTVKKDLGALRREINKHKDCRDPEKLKKLAEKRDLLRMKIEALEKEGEQFRDQQRKQINLLEQELNEKYERMHGLLAYGVASGGLSADATLLYNTLGDVLAAKTAGDRAAGQRAVSLILKHGNAFGKEVETDSSDCDVHVNFATVDSPKSNPRITIHEH